MFGVEHDLELLRGFTEDEILDRDRNERDFRAYIYFFELLLFHESTTTRTIQGCSFSQRRDDVLLVVKSTDNGIPQVAYTTEKTPRGCIVSFGRRYLEGRVVWHPDKYARV